MKHRGSWGSFLKVCTQSSALVLQNSRSCNVYLYSTNKLQSIASFNGDLASLTAPAFILSTQSLVEFSAYWTENTPLFIAPTKEPSPEKRMLLVMKWLLNTLKQQYCSRSEKLGSEKKPLNPFLGELYLGHWDDEFGRTDLVSEQVSHHPPVTAYCITNEKHGIQLQGYNAQKASFARTIHVKQIGHSLMTFTPPGSSTPEQYLISLPALHIENLIYGAPFVELGKFTHIVSSSGLVAKMDFAGKGWVSGKKNSFNAQIWNGAGSHHGPGHNERDPIYSADGQWSEAFDLKEGSGKKAIIISSFKPSDIKLSRLNVAPIEEQDPLESRKAWSQVSRAIDKGDMDATSYFKSRIEQAQRALRAKELKEGRSWQRVFFRNVSPDEPEEAGIQKLVKMCTALGWEGLAPDKTGGIWRFDPAKAREAKRPFHEDAMAALGERGAGQVAGDTSSDVSRVTTQEAVSAT
jgi:hypothetical protein